MISCLTRWPQIPSAHAVNASGLSLDIFFFPLSVDFHPFCFLMDLFHLHDLNGNGIRKTEMQG